MLTLKNLTGATSKIGFLVSIPATNPDSFIYTIPNSTRTVGVVTETVAYRKPCKIATIGDTANVYVTGNVVKGDVIRASKSNDRASLGTCVIAKIGDAPYLRVGEALSSGSGFITCTLDLQYVSGINDSLGVGAIPDGIYTVGLGMMTDGVIVVKNGIIISLTEAT